MWLYHRFLDQRQAIRRALRWWKRMFLRLVRVFDFHYDDARIQTYQLAHNEALNTRAHKSSSHGL